ncbi:MAG: OmpA family protein [Verrucomicrobiota bacterium]
MSPDNAAEVRTIRKWFLVALLLSLALHGGLYELLKSKHLDQIAFSAPAPQFIPRAFTVKKVIIDEKLLKPEPTPEAKKSDPPKTVLSNEKPSSENLANEVRFTPATPAASELGKAIAGDKPRVQPGLLASPKENAAIEREIDSIRAAIASKNAPKIAAGRENALPDSRQGTSDTPGYSNLDNLLTQAGPLTGPVAPVNVPGGALFEYDSATLSKEAIQTLGKLGVLIERNPRSTFNIEGYTDSFGSPDYNKKLSAARAEAVKTWLVTYMKIDPSRIQAKGLGSANLKAPATGTREQQAPNRRVEIVITTPKD